MPAFRQVSFRLCHSCEANLLQWELHYIFCYATLLFIAWINHYLSGIDREYHFYFKPLTKFNPHFQGIANLDTLVPQLCQREIILPNEAEELYYMRTRCEKITHLLAVLSRKGTDGVEGLIDSLEADTQHPAHHQLAHILRKEYYNFRKW